MGMKTRTVEFYAKVRLDIGTLDEDDDELVIENLMESGVIELAQVTIDDVDALDEDDDEYVMEITNAEIVGVFIGGQVVAPRVLTADEL